MDCLAENTHLILHAIEGIIENLKELEEILMYDVDHRNRYGPAALMEAALLGHWDFVEELINANKDLEDNEGCTALELAENCGRNKKERLRRRHPNYAPESLWKDCEKKRISEVFSAIKVWEASLKIARRCAVYICRYRARIYVFFFRRGAQDNCSACG